MNTYSTVTGISPTEGRGLNRFSDVLFIGPDCNNHRGGIGAVLATYKNNIPDFKFLASYDGNLGAGNVLKFIAFLFALVRTLFKDRQIRIVHIHGASRGSFYRKYLVFLICKYGFRKKIIYHLHGGGFHLFFSNSNGIVKKLIRHLFKKADMVIGLSRTWEDFIRNEIGGKHVVILNNPIQLPDATEPGIENSGMRVLLFLGKVNDNKGIFDLLSVIKEHYDELRGRIKLKIGGNGETDRLSDFIKQYALQDVVEYQGWVDGKMKADLLEECDALILPSYNEGLPVSVLEAMSYSKLVITTRVGGIPEVIVNMQNGILMEPGDKVALSDALFLFINDPPACRQMGNEARRTVTEFDVEVVLNRLEEIYEKI